PSCRGAPLNEFLTYYISNKHCEITLFLRKSTQKKEWFLRAYHRWLYDKSGWWNWGDIGATKLGISCWLVACSELQPRAKQVFPIPRPHPISLRGWNKWFPSTWFSLKEIIYASLLGTVGFKNSR